MNRKRNPNKDIQIDTNNLEFEIIEHPSLYLHYSNLYAESVEEKDKAKQRVDLIYAQVESNIRQKWDLFFSEKPTESAVKGKIIQDASYRKAQNILIKTTKTVNVIKGIVTAFEHRKKAIEGAVSMKIGGFYSEPRKRNNRQGGRSETLKKRIIAKDTRQ